jgi:NADPH-dependent 2,4-dienoyl-CoA reductase/sulfur reductase-like enzyme
VIDPVGSIRADRPPRATNRVMLSEIVVVGGSLAGLRAVESLRSNGYEGAITVVSAEDHLPYDRPPLSKRLLAGEWEAERVALRKPEEMGSLEATWKLGSVAVGLDVESRAVLLADGSTLGFDGAILATGAAPIRLPGQDQHSHAVVLRSIDDAIDLRDRIASGDRKVVVIGAGFIGLEVAATARQLGNEVLVLEGAPAPLIRGLGAEMGEAVAAVHTDNGVTIRCDVTVEGLADGAVLIDGGRQEPADVVVVGIGARPVTDWLADSALDIRDGVVCRPDLNVGVPLIYAAGDVARWYNELFDEEMRIEHWTNAAEQGALAAENMLSESAGEATAAYSPVPFVWSEQYDSRIQFLGRSAPGDDVQVVAGSIEERKFAALYGREGRLHGVLGVNMPRNVMPYRKLLIDGVGWEDALAHAAG